MVSQIRLNSDRKVEELSARARELARKIVTFWDGYEEHLGRKKILCRKHDSNTTVKGSLRTQPYNWHKRFSTQYAPKTDGIPS